MIKDGKRYLNLEDQVEWNKNHIEAFLAGMETVNIFGIRVLAVVPSSEDIPLQETYSYGDAYAVGENPPYHYYVYTRSGLEAIEGTFVDIGEFPGKGEKGEQGAPGKDGENGKTPYIGANEHWWIGGVDTGVSARGPAGIGLRGPQGPRGQAGGYRLYGELSSISQLPTPTKAIQDDDGAYIISGELWMVMGLTSLEWYNLGKVGGTGMRGEPGVGIESMTKLTTPYGEGKVTYDTTDGIHLTGQTRIDYGDDFSKQVDADTALPIKAGVGVSMDATEDGKHIEIKADETWVNEAIDSKVNPVKSNKRDIVQPGAKGKAARIYSVSPISDSYPEGAQGYIEAGTSNFTQYSVPQRAANGQLNLPNQLTYVPSNHQAISKIYADTHYSGGGDSVMLDTSAIGFLGADKIDQAIEAFKAGKSVFVHYINSSASGDRPANGTYGQMISYGQASVAEGDPIVDCITVRFSPIVKSLRGGGYIKDTAKSYSYTTFAGGYSGNHLVFSNDGEFTRLSFDDFPSSATSGTLTDLGVEQAILKRDRSMIVFNKEIYYKADIGHQEGYVTYTHTGYENSKFIHKAITINTNNWSWELNTSE